MWDVQQLILFLASLSCCQSLSNSPACSAECRQALAEALCAEVLVSLPTDEEEDALAPLRAQLMLAEEFRPILQPRAAALYNELGCVAQPVPPLQPKGVDNGKSAMNFLVPGGAGVQPHDAASYSIIIKQLNAQDVQLLPSLVPQLVPRYLQAEGSLLARFLGWVRDPPAPGRFQFDAIVMENVARPPPGAAASPWTPFDMKGIRLYPHEMRFGREFGKHGLHVAAVHAESHSAALRGDLALLTARKLVDYSFLVNVFPSGGPPRPCAQMQHAADFAPSTARPLPPASRLLPAYFPLENASLPRPAEERSEARGLCGSAVVRLALIDYLREWGRTEQLEHLQKSVTRDLLALEVKHAVVPVQPFAKRLDKFFHEGLLRAAPRPAPPTGASIAEELSHIQAALRCAGAELLRHARSLPTELPARLQRLRAELRRVGLDLEAIESGMHRAGLPARLWRMRDGLERRLSLTLDGLRTASARLLAVQTPTWLRLWARASTKATYDNIY